jgi:ribose-phosphate pyrophosphokinase
VSKSTGPLRIRSLANRTPLINQDDVRFFSGQSHPALAEGIVNYLGVNLEQTIFERFGNDNLYIQLGASVRGRKVFIVQSLIPPVNEHLMELFIMLDIARSAGASQVHAIIPYYSYARSDKKNAPRISITARLIADLLVTAGATHVMTMTLHSPQVHGFFSVPTDPLTARGLFVEYLQNRLYKLDDQIGPERTIVVAPDYGRAGSAARLAEFLGLASISAEKRRISDTTVEISSLIIRQVQGFKRAIIYDDEIASGSSVIELSEKLVEGGIQEIFMVCSHGLFVNNALKRIFDIPQVIEIITTDTCPQPKDEPRLKVLSAAPIIGEAIRRNFMHQSIGDLFAFGVHEDPEPE